MLLKCKVEAGEDRGAGRQNDRLDGVQAAALVDAARRHDGILLAVTLRTRAGG